MHLLVALRGRLVKVVGHVLIELLNAENLLLLLRLLGLAVVLGPASGDGGPLRALLRVAVLLLALGGRISRGKRDPLEGRRKLGLVRDERNFHLDGSSLSILVREGGVVEGGKELLRKGRVLVGDLAGHGLSLLILKDVDGGSRAVESGKIRL